MNFEWDPLKAEANLRKHGVSFEEASSVFLDPLAVTYPDPDHSGEEEREITIGHSSAQRAIFVSHCYRAERIRIISARMVVPRERRQHEKAAKK